MKYQVMVMKVTEIAIVEVEAEDFLLASDEAMKREDLQFMEPWEDIKMITAQYFPQFGGIGIDPMKLG